MKRIARCVLLAALLAVAGCTAPGPADEAARRAEALQAAVPAAIDCGRFAARPLDVEADVAGTLGRATSATRYWLRDGFLARAVAAGRQQPTDRK